MYSMIIADDEPVILDGLCRMLDWNELGISIVRQFSSGDEVIDFLKDNSCDILITDIKMPKKNGLDILKFINKKKLRTQTIFISGFSEFSYAHEALHNGAVDYLTKPVNKDLLLDAVKKSIRALPCNDIRLEKKLIDYGIINSVNIDITDSKKNDAEFYTAINVYMDTSALSKHQYELLLFSFTAEMEQLLTMNNIVFARGNAICIIISHNTRNEVLDASENILDVIQTKMSMNAVIIAGKSVSGTTEIPNSYKSAEKLEHLCFYCDTSTIIDCENTPAPQTKSADIDIAGIEKSAIENMYKLNGAKLENSVNELVERINAVSGFIPSTVKAYVISALHRLSTEIRSINTNKAFNSQIDDIFIHYSNEINLAQRFCNVRRLTAECVLEAKSRLNELDISSVEAIVKSREFIKEHYSENITLDSVAKNVFMNSFYFSTFFKKHTGKNFKEYLNEIRLENAERLLITSNMHLTEIAEKTGFKSLRSMNELFFKAHGETPGEYRKNLKNERHDKA